MDPRSDLLAGISSSATPPEASTPPHAERTDAARNRAKVLAAAAELFATRDPRTVTMDDIAKAAGVGRGTLYRRYPDKNSIAVALLDEHERTLQEKLLRGDPPLGPGAPPDERLAAFYTAMVELLEAHAHLVLGAESSGARFRTGAYGFWYLHVRSLLVAGGIADPDALVDSLLAPLAAEVFQHQRGRGSSAAHIAEALSRLAHSVISTATS
ncbi:helix-turn-helix domain-containing protein [Nocardia sp. NPDC051463]|uniref:TetR/AcrR family transcriptional regulator n=1 Tax=Nocardia sp. NPDC051463 TaxID=3154845 RepID=UPI00344F6393